MSPAIIQLRGVTKVYGSGQAELLALKGIDLDITAGEFVAIMGPSGSGKSTAMNIMGCLDTPSAGQYLFRGAHVETLSRDQRARLRRRYLGFVFQGFNLLARTSAQENVELPLLYRGESAAVRRAAAAAALKSVGLGGWEHHTPAELSGGQQQRVAIARALVTEPAVLLADEPTGNLDTQRSQEIMELLRGLNAEQGITVLMVTHEPDMAAYAQRWVRSVDGRNWQTNIVGSSNAWFDTGNWKLSQGRIFADDEQTAGAAVCITGETVRREIYGGPVGLRGLGELLRIKQFSCTVIGVLASKGQAAFGNDQDDTVLVPLATLQRRVTGNQRVNTLQVSMQDGSDSTRLKASLRELLRERRKLAAGDKDNFNILDTQQLAETLSGTTQVITTLLGAVAAVSLLVGGIGIMNIMLVSVTERTRAGPTVGQCTDRARRSPYGRQGASAFGRRHRSTAQGMNMDTNYVTRDNFGMYAKKNDGPGRELMGADTLLGNDVYNKDGEDLGDIKEFMFDMASGKVAYAVLSFGGVLGLGDKLFAVPWPALKLDTENKRFTLDVLKETLKDAPGFDKDNWPTISDKTWAGGIHKFYATPYSGD